MKREKLFFTQEELTSVIIKIKIIRKRYQMKWNETYFLSTVIIPVQNTPVSRSL